MSPSTICSRPPRLTSRLIGAMNAAIRSWKATSPPRERLPFITLKPPRPRIRAVLTAESRGGTASSIWV